jgi:hypothetical protein
MGLKTSILAKKQHTDRALKIVNARILCGVYYGLLAVVFTLTLDATLYYLGFNQFIPLFAGALLAMFIATIFGMLFGEAIIHAKYPFKKHVFTLGFIKTLIALPFYDLGFLWFYLQAHPDVMHALTWSNFFPLYFKVIFFSLILIGVWLAILSGLAALYLRYYLVYYIYDSKDD